MNKLLTLLILTSTSLFAQKHEQKLDELFSTEIGKLKIPNIDISVVNKDSIIYTRSFGIKEFNSDLYYLGSVSKSLTALSILKLIEKGKLELNDKVSEIIPEIIYNEKALEITVRHLLNHTSGISKRSGFGNLPKLTELRNSKFSIDVMQQPGENHEYSNINYSILGLIIERITGVAFSEYISSEVFAPLKMNSSKIILSGQLSSNILSQYQYWGPFPVKSKQFDYAETAIPAGFILSNTQDMSKYLSMILANGNYKNEKFIEPTSITEMLTPWNNSDFGYCMGWKKGKYNGKTIYQHLGSTATSYSAIFIIPENNIGFTFLTNTNSLSYSENIAESILNILTDGDKFKTSRNEFYVRIGILIAILLILVNLTFKIIKGKTSMKKPSLKRISIVLAANISLLIGFIIIFPVITNVPFVTFIKLQPDLGTLIILAFGSSLLLSLVKLSHYFQLKAKNGSIGG